MLFHIVDKCEECEQENMFNLVIQQAKSFNLAVYWRSLCSGWKLRVNYL